MFESPDVQTLPNAQLKQVLVPVESEYSPAGHGVLAPSVQEYPAGQMFPPYVASTLGEVTNTALFAKSQKYPSEHGLKTEESV